MSIAAKSSAGQSNFMHFIKCINFNPIKICIFDIDSDKLWRNTKGTKTDMLNYNYICIEMRLNFKCNLRECIIMVSWWKKKTNQPIMLLDKIIIWIRAICSCVLCVFRKFLFLIDLGQKADPVQEDASDHEEHCIIDFTSYLNTYALCGVLFVLILIIAFSWKMDHFHKAFHVGHIEPYWWRAWLDMRNRLVCWMLSNESSIFCFYVKIIVYSQ